VAMSGSDLLSELSIKIYEPPFSLLREDGRIANVADPVCALMLVLDFDTEVAMNGIADFIGNSTGRYGRETVLALRKIECPDQAEILAEILASASDAGMTHEAIQADRAALREFDVTSFNAVHGDKWATALATIERLSDALDFPKILERAETFTREHSSAVAAALGHDSRTIDGT
jgi:hypothetical protein